MGYAGKTLGEIPPKFKSRYFGHHDATIFVWRCPEQRLISLYRNKVLDGKDNEDLIARYRKHMGECPSTFEAFVEFAQRQADHHFIPQVAHLKAFRYTHAIPLGRLHEAMINIVGEEAATPFVRPINSSSSSSLNAEVEVTSKARDMIRRIYADDYALLEKLRTRV